MDFFEHQDKARKNTKVLVVYFGETGEPEPGTDDPVETAVVPEGEQRASLATPG